MPTAERERETGRNPWGSNKFLKLPAAGLRLLAVLGACAIQRVTVAMASTTLRGGDAGGYVPRVAKGGGYVAVTWRLRGSYVAITCQGSRRAAVTMANITSDSSTMSRTMKRGVALRTPSTIVVKLSPCRGEWAGRPTAAQCAKGEHAVWR